MSHLQLATSRIYRWPLAIALVTFAGLLSALLGDGVWNVTSWIFLAIPVLVVVRTLVINAR